MSVRGERGFTLLEVLVAFAILSIAVVAVIQGFAAGLRLLRLSGEHQAAVLLADQKLREVVAPAAGRQEGTEGAYEWERETSVEPAPDLDRTPVAALWRVYRIVVRVRWSESRQVELTALRTAPAEPEAAARP